MYVVVKIFFVLQETCFNVEVKKTNSESITKTTAKLKTGALITQRINVTSLAKLHISRIFCSLNVIDEQLYFKKKTHFDMDVFSDITCMCQSVFTRVVIRFL